MPPKSNGQRKSHSRVGFSSISYFSRCFTRRFGLSPRQYQKRICGLP
ncbi:MAG: AraC family transcriptional regulator [Victivallales bacterium]|nr:AraC family transcriptional regulator [Victivallales bacterium]